MLRDRSLLDRTLSSAEQAVLYTLASRLREHFGERLVHLVVLGSRARGDVSIDSDIDLLVVVDFSGVDEERDVDAIWRMTGEAKGATKTYVPIAPLILSRERFDELRKQRRRFALDADREGIAL